MKLSDLTAETRQKLSACRWDRIIEKHEGPWAWRYRLEHESVEFLRIAGFDVLLPIEKENHPHLTITRCIPSADGMTLTIFLQDTTYDEGFLAGYLAVCERFPGEAWYVAILYHECWVERLEV